MPRPKRCRKVCEEPYFSKFVPECGGSLTVEMTVDEYEVIRLVDFEGKRHEECAKQMEISRTTVTEIYENARYKLADCIVNGKNLQISGGNFRLCDGNSRSCIKCGSDTIKLHEIVKKGEKIMRIAVTYENEKVFQHFGHTSKFKIYDVEDSKVVNKSVISTNGQGHGALSSLLGNMGVDVLICGGIGGGAQMALAELGIKLHGGVSGDCDEVVQYFINGQLEFNPNVKCSHHDHEHGDTAHACGEHGCGKGNCHHGE